MFKPFENDHQSMQIGELIFENQTDKVIVYGDIDITKTAVGLEQALKLKKVFTDIADKLQEADSNRAGLTRQTSQANTQKQTGEKTREETREETRDIETATNIEAKSNEDTIIDNPFS